MTKTKWVIDPTHSEFQFKVKHLMISTVTGHFKKIYLEATTEEEDFTKIIHVKFNIDTASVETNNVQRDNHLRSADFFESEFYPQIEFTTTTAQGTIAQGFIKGDLSIRGNTKPVVVKIDYGGIVVDAYGNTKAGFTVTGKINRKDFGLNWNSLTEAGNIVLGDEVKYEGQLQLIKQI